MARRRPADDEDDDDDAPKKKRKPSRRDDDEDDDDDGDDDLADLTKPKKAGENAYTGLLAITFLGLVSAAVLLFLDASELGDKPPPAPTVSVPALGSAGGQ